MHWQRLVRIGNGGDDFVEATIRGSQRYAVDLSWRPGALAVTCECPYFDATGPCKHIWAAILTAEAHGLLSWAASDPNLAMQEELGGVSRDSSEADEVPTRRQKPSEPIIAPWRRQLAGIASTQEQAPRPASSWPAKRELIYVVDATASAAAGRAILATMGRDRKKDGTLSKPIRSVIRRDWISQLPKPEDRELISTLAGAPSHWGGNWAGGELASQWRLEPPLNAMILRQAAGTGRLFFQPGSEPDSIVPLAWDDGAPWDFSLDVTRHGERQWELSGFLTRGEERKPLSAIALAVPGLVFTESAVAPLAETASYDWLQYLRRHGAILAPDEDREEFVAALLESPGIPRFELPAEAQIHEEAAPLRPALKIHGPAYAGAPGALRADLSFRYAGRPFKPKDQARGWYDSKTRTFHRRDSDAEKAAANLLTEAGARYENSSYRDVGWEVAPKKLPRVVRTLVQHGWEIEAEGKVFRRPSEHRLSVTSGVDWFELHGEVNYEGGAARLPELLEALRRGDSMVRLSDGTYGMIPEEWLRKIGAVAGMGEAENGHVRFRRSQAGLLDALLASQPEASFDQNFARVREELRSFQGVEAAPQPGGFEGTLRDYQREGLGWIDFLRRFGFGGCLADDMGVGKTAQVLALLENRREARAAGEPLPPSLAVVPRSLVFNWLQEAARFTPRLKILDYTGLARDRADFDKYDLIVTTYGTLRRDIPALTEIEFDYVVLDEAQAIKNSDTESSKAARLLRGRHRLALSGTPVENHLGELWSLFDFLNPGMLGGASVFKVTGAGMRNADEETRRLLAHALRPFILRRTKEQVARELPAKTEQTVYCELKPEQRKLYEELRQHYRASLLGKVETDGLGKSKMMVLEALLRLRQVACHPGLIDPKRRSEPSAKLDTLLSQIREVLDEGHKALVFSQFTSLLAMVRERLDEAGMTYEYLDGQTRDRQAPVERFQTDPECKLFLISLKAGGLGLNLTAAEYVFLLDPWWNPAVEAQAIDRAHRIGQTRNVFAYRLIARGTVEEKVLELQASKRDLAAAIIREDNSLIRDLKREDLELLLS